MGRSGRVGRGGENDQNILYKILEELTKIGKKKKTISVLGIGRNSLHHKNKKLN